MATNLALVRKTGGVEDPNVWFDDLTKAVQPVLGNWTTIYAGIHKDKLEDKTLTIREAAMDLRKEAERRNILYAGERGSKVMRGAFSPTLAGEPGPSSPSSREAEVAGANSPQDGNRKRKPKEAQPSRRKRAATLNQSDDLCKACDGAHQLAKCYYAFPKLSPEHLKERKLVRDAFEYRIRNDSSLRDEVDRINKANLIQEHD